MNKILYFDYRGTKYPLLMNLYAMEMIEEEFGSTGKLTQELLGGKTFTTMKSVFRILGNAARESLGQPEDITGNEIRHASPEEMTDLADLMKQALRLGRYSETAPGESAGDEKVDIFEDEEDKKNG